MASGCLWGCVRHFRCVISVPCEAHVHHKARHEGGKRHTFWPPPHWVRGGGAPRWDDHTRGIETLNLGIGFMRFITTHQALGGHNAQPNPRQRHHRTAQANGPTAPPRGAGQKENPAKEPPRRGKVPAGGISTGLACAISLLAEELSTQSGGGVPDRCMHVPCRVRGC